MSTSLRRRMFPLYIAAALQGVGLWVPIEKLFMGEIGFDAATIGVMAAAYAALVPIVEVPSGILADRWSRRGVLMVAGAALTLSALLGGLSTSVPAYIGSALVLGVYFAMYSGTMDSIVYDTVLEETGGSAPFERQIGRLRFVESLALVASALAGGWIAGLTEPRLTYFLTVPFTALSILALVAFKEPQLHKTEEKTSMRSQLTLTYRAVTDRTWLLPIALLGVLTALLLQSILEFGPLWLVALSVSAILYGPFWAGLVSTLGLGGLLAGRLRLDRPATLLTVTALMTASSLALTASRHIAVVTLAQIVLALLIVTTSIHATRLLHDAVPSTVRSGVASGVSALSWIAFLPFAVIFGLVTKNHGVHAAGWMLTAITALTGLVLVKVALGQGSRIPAPQPIQEAPQSASAR